MEHLKCPYCSHAQEVNHDDGAGYEEDRAHEMECYECEKTFVFSTNISFHYRPSKADCLNGADHNLRLSTTVPRRYTKMGCKDCDFTRQLTGIERIELGPEYK